jgi:hypothetical protein
MGIYRTDYLIYGWKLNKEQVTDFDTLYFKSQDGELDVNSEIIDHGEHKNREFFYYGITMKSSDRDDAWDGYIINSDNIDKNQLKQEYKKVFGLSPIEDPQIIIMSSFR